MSDYIPPVEAVSELQSNIERVCEQAYQDGYEDGINDASEPIRHWADVYIDALYCIAEREKYRCIRFVSGVLIVMAILLSIPLVAFQTLGRMTVGTYTSTITDASGMTTTTTINGNQTIITVTDSNGRIVSTVVSGRR